MHASQLSTYAFLPLIVPHVANCGVATASNSSFRKLRVLYFPFFESVPKDQIKHIHMKCLISLCGDFKFGVFLLCAIWKEKKGEYTSGGAP